MYSHNSCTFFWKYFCQTVEYICFVMLCYFKQAFNDYCWNNYCMRDLSNLSPICAQVCNSYILNNVNATGWSSVFSYSYCEKQTLIWNKNLEHFWFLTLLSVL
jgi:hypothetical protein